MRYYLMPIEGSEVVVDLAKTTVQTGGLVEFVFASPDGDPKGRQSTIYLRKIAGGYFTSMDGVRWTRIPRLTRSSKIVVGNQTYDLYRGYKPSGVGGAHEGDLVTQMPGMVAKIHVTPGQIVKKGDVLLILDAMKMENQIISSREGIIREIFVREGESLAKGRIIMELEALE
ncbi:MAG: biotin/lipoyl-binding protein [bacterium]|nr:biotin/lipoyl-binding protein [bacterium]